MASYSSKKLRSGLDQHTAADRTISTAEEGTAGNGPSPVGPLEGVAAAAHGDELNPQAAVRVNRVPGLALSQRKLRALEEEENNLDSSMGIGPVSHRSLASSGSAAVTEGAAVSQKTIREAHMSGNSFGSSGRLVPRKCCMIVCSRKVRLLVKMCVLDHSKCRIYCS